MSFYDNFTKRNKITKLEKLIVKRQNSFFVNFIFKYLFKDRKDIKILEIDP